MKSPPNDPEWLLTNPNARRWMVQCLGCRRWGYRQDAPDVFFNRPHLERNFQAFALDSRGLCDQCSEASPKEEDEGWI